MVKTSPCFRFVGLSLMLYCGYIIYVCICRNPELLDECDIDEKTKEVLLENIKRRLTPQSVKIRAGMLYFSY